MYKGWESNPIELNKFLHSLELHMNGSNRKQYTTYFENGTKRQTTAQVLEWLLSDKHRRQM